MDVGGDAAVDLGDGRGEDRGFSGQFVGGGEVGFDDADEDGVGVGVGVPVFGVFGEGDGAEADPGAVGFGAEDGAGGVGDLAGEAVGRWGAVADEVDVEDRHRRVVGQPPCGASAISPASAIASISAAV